MQGHCKMQMKAIKMKKLKVKKKTCKRKMKMIINLKQKEKLW